MRLVSSEWKQARLARMTGPRAVEWYEHTAVFKLDPGSGRLAAWMIQNAPLVMMAVRWFDRNCLTYPRSDSELVEAAMIKRTRGEGVTTVGCAFLVKHNVHSPEETYEWLIGEFEDCMRQLRQRRDRTEQ